MSIALRNGWAAVFHPAVVCAPSDAPSDDTRLSEGKARGDARPGTTSSTSSLTQINGIPVPELLSRLQTGDREAFATIYQALHRPLWRLGVILTRSSENAEEIVQDVFLSLWRHRATLVPTDDIRAYLYAAVRNQARSVGRHAQVVDRTEDQITHDTPAFSQTAPSPDIAAETSEFYEAYQRALTVLTEREQIVLQLRVEEELTFEEIGALLGVSKMGAHKIVVRAVGKIGQLLAAYRP